MTLLEWGKTVGEESRRTFAKKLANGFFDKYMTGQGVDIGGKGYIKDVHAILPTATIVDLDYPGYDGKTLPFASDSLDYIYSSHTLEHIQAARDAIHEWFRVVKVGGHLVIVVPHQWLYEKKHFQPSRFNGDHQHFFTPGKLLAMVEESLRPNTYRIRLLEDGDEGFDYSIGPEKHSNGQYEITLCLQKIQEPQWKLQ